MGTTGKRSKARRILQGFAIALAVLLAIAFFPRPAAKSIRKPVQTTYSVNDEAFRDSISHLIDTPLVPGNRVIALYNGDQIFPPQLEAIRKARKSITMENFIFRSGKLSAQFVPVLCEKARAGVDVRLIMDSMGCAKLQQPELDTLEQAGVKFVKYNRTEWHKLLRVNHRDHRKLLVVDGEVGFTGGACLADEWLGNADNEKLWRDIHFQIEGPAVSQLQGIFMDNWMQTQHEVLHGTNFFPHPTTNGSVYAQCFKTGPKDGVESARLVYLYSIAAARNRIRIAHSYFVPDDLLVNALLAAVQRGVKVEVITPGIIDANVVRRASRARWDKLIRAGVEFHEYQPSLFHCKIMIVDDVWVTAGTVNFDNRSFRINDENGLNVWDKDFAAAQIKAFEDDKAKSRRISVQEYQGRAWYVKAAEHFAAFFRAWL